MKLPNPNAQIFVPAGTHLADALKRTTHIGIGAHQDDEEFMAFHGVLACFANEQQWFGGVNCTNRAFSRITS